MVPHGPGRGGESLARRLFLPCRWVELNLEVLARRPGQAPDPGGMIWWVHYNDLTVLPHWKSWFILGKSSPFMAALYIQVSEIL